ncbi:MAG TPA: ABC transporter ATP-binding protein [Gemmatimonadaceae bacterium]|nr:ABC transporter ATP-binding protein [Gemmatimonadaceae bacterium]
MIEFGGVSKIYGGPLGRRVTAVEDLTLAIQPGEVVGIAGPNGAGKSTLIAMLLGYVAPTSGEIRIAGEPPRRWIERHGIGYLSELIAIEPRWRAREALVRYAVLAGIREREVGARVDAAIDRLGLGEHRDKRVRALSKGNLQRLGLAQALLREEAVYVLDEPTHGLDPVWTQRFRGIVGELRGPGRILFIASHNLDELQRVADRVAIIDQGRLQRVVDTRAGGSASGAMTYRLVIAEGADHVGTSFAGAIRVADNEWELPAITVTVLNDGLSRLLSLGGRVAAVMPARSALEEEFRAAIAGADADAGGGGGGGP